MDILHMLHSELNTPLNTTAIFAQIQKEFISTSVSQEEIQAMNATRTEKQQPQAKTAKKRTKK